RRTRWSHRWRFRNGPRGDFWSWWRRFGRYGQCLLRWRLDTRIFVRRLKRLGRHACACFVVRPPEHELCLGEEALKLLRYLDAQIERRDRARRDMRRQLRHLAPSLRGGERTRVGSWPLRALGLLAIQQSAQSRVARCETVGE